MVSMRGGDGDAGNAVPGPSNYQDRHVTGYAEIPSYGTPSFRPTICHTMAFHSGVEAHPCVRSKPTSRY